MTNAGYLLIIAFLLIAFFVEILKPEKKKKPKYIVYDAKDE